MPTNYAIQQAYTPYPPISDRDPVIEGNDDTNHLLGTASGDIMIGHGGDDTLAGGGGFDVMTGGAGNDWLHGAAGTDVAVYRGALSDYSYEVVGGTVTRITDLRAGSPDGYDRLTGTEFLVFGKETYFASFIPGAPSGDDARAQAAPAEGGINLQASGGPNGWLLDQEFYLKQNVDVAEAVSRGETTAQAHWETYGQFEVRSPNGLFNANYYLANNADLSAAFGTDEKAALSHWLTYGIGEGRDSTALFSSEVYLTANVDVAESDFTAVEHFLLYGHNEGRAAIVDSAWLGLT